MHASAPFLWHHHPPSGDTDDAIFIEEFYEEEDNNDEDVELVELPGCSDTPPLFWPVDSKARVMYLASVY